MEKTVKRRGRLARWMDRLPIRRAFMLYAAVYSMLAIALVVETVVFCEGAREQIVRDAVADIQFEVDHYELALVNAAVVLSGFDDSEIMVLREDDLGPWYEGLSYVQVLCVLMWPLFCLWLAARRFYRRKLRTPLRLLADASGRIAQNDLDFSLPTDGRDELGRLCADFERMRASVLRHERELWSAGEAHRRRTAALEHDLRTPLTVLKGQTELLEQTADRVDPERLKSALSSMRSHIERMERYIADLTRLRSVEEAEPRIARTDVAALQSELTQTGRLLCDARGMHFALQCEDAPRYVRTDAQLVARVFDNLVQNAARYAHTRVDASLTQQDGRLVLCVRDDGPGFSPEALHHAAEPFFSECRAGRDGHLGLGLHIARVLCERLGGSLQLQNDGGAVVRADVGAAEE